MATLVFFREGASPEQVTSIHTRADPAPFRTRTDVLVSPDLAGLITFDENSEVDTFLVPKKYWKHVTGSILEYTQAEKDAQDAAEIDEAAANETARLDGIRSDAAGGLNDFDVTPLLLRAFADILKDEINTLRALHALPDRTLGQLRTAITNKVNSGDVDT